MKKHPLFIIYALIICVISIYIASQLEWKNPEDKEIQQQPVSQKTSEHANENILQPPKKRVNEELPHPSYKIILTEERLDTLKATLANDPTLQQYISKFLRRADTIMKSAPLEYKPTDRGTILKISRECLKRTYCLGLAYRWTKDRKYFDALRTNLLTVSAFPDWNPKHFLDTAEMTHAVAVGYNWLYEDLSPEERTILQDAIVRKGLIPGTNAYTGKEKYGWWVGSNHNWNLVCNSGMLIGALAVADSNPAYKTSIIQPAIKSVPIALKQYGPDGAWGEGPGYWSYSTSYVCYMLSALQTAQMDECDDLIATKGLSETGTFPFYSTGPTHIPLGYADCWAGKELSPAPALFWLAQTYEKPFISNFQHELIERSDRIRAQDIIWYVPPVSTTFET